MASVPRSAWFSCALIASCNTTTGAPPPTPAIVETPQRSPGPSPLVSAEPTPAPAVATSPDIQTCSAAPPGMRCIPGGALPQHPDARVSTFYLDERPVTHADLAACRTAHACPGRGASKLENDEPAALDWPRARQVCAWAGKRLPTVWERSLAAAEIPLGTAEWTATAGKQLLEAPTGDDPQGACDGAYPCTGQRVLLSSATQPRLEPERSLRRAPAVHCASSTALLTTWPPGQISTPPERPPAPQPLPEDLRRQLLALDHDPIEDKPICDEEVRATWGPSLARGGRATTTCRDPFPYVKANEGRTHVWAPFVTNLGGAYLGVASDQNYSLIAAARSELAFLMDYDPRVVALHRRLRALILHSETPEAFIARFAPEAQRESLALLEQVYPDAPDLPALKAGFRANRDELHLYYQAQLDRPPRDQPADFGWLQPGTTRTSAPSTSKTASSRSRATSWAAARSPPSPPPPGPPACRCASSTSPTRRPPGAGRSRRAIAATSSPSRSTSARSSSRPPTAAASAKTATGTTTSTPASISSSCSPGPATTPS